MKSLYPVRTMGTVNVPGVNRELVQKQINTYQFHEEMQRAIWMSGGDIVSLGNLSPKRNTKNIRMSFVQKNNSPKAKIAWAYERGSQSPKTIHLSVSNVFVDILLLFIPNRSQTEQTPQEDDGTAERFLNWNVANAKNISKAKMPGWM